MYCTKCGNKVGDSDNFCTRCGARCKQSVAEVTENRAESRAQYLDAWQDAQFMGLLREYYALLESIEADYSVFVNGYGGAEAGQKLEEKCLRGTIAFKCLVPFYKKYEHPLPNSCPPFKRLAMLREKRGDYEGAALACVQQMRLGVFGDGSKSGMRGRLARLVKRGDLDQNPEIMKDAQQYLKI